MKGYFAYLRIIYNIQIFVLISRKQVNEDVEHKNDINRCVRCNEANWSGLKSQRIGGVDASYDHEATKDNQISLNLIKWMGAYNVTKRSQSPFAWSSGRIIIRRCLWCTRYLNLWEQVIPSVGSLLASAILRASSSARSLLSFSSLAFFSAIASMASGEGALGSFFSSSSPPSVFLSSVLSDESSSFFCVCSSGGAWTEVRIA